LANGAFSGLHENCTISHRPIVMFHCHFAALPAYHAVQNGFSQRITPTITPGNSPEKSGGHRAACLSGVVTLPFA
jgi:hypothetical protein